MTERQAIDFAAINRAATARLPELVRGWLPGGAFESDEYVVRNPKRNDLSPGSFKINTRTGKWRDFAGDVGGGDPISLLAFLDDVKHGEAAKRLAHNRHNACSGPGLPSLLCRLG